MKYLTLVISIAGLVAVVVWAYNVNYQTRQAYQRLADLRAEIAAEGETLQVLRVEWAWLNSPERLRALVKTYEAELQLTHLRADHFSYAGSVPFPPRPPLVLDPEKLWPLPEPPVAEVEVPLLPIPVPRPAKRTLEVRWSTE